MQSGQSIVGPLEQDLRKEPQHEQREGQGVSEALERAMSHFLASGVPSSWYTLGMVTDEVPFP